MFLFCILFSCYFSNPYFCFSTYFLLVLHTYFILVLHTYVILVFRTYFNYFNSFNCSLAFSDVVEDIPVFTVFSNSKNGPCLRTVDRSIVSTVSLAYSGVIDQVIQELFHMWFGNSQSVVPRYRR